MTHGTADVSVLREGDDGSSRQSVLSAHDPLPVGGQAEVVVPLDELVLDGTAGVDQVLAVPVAEDHSAALWLGRDLEICREYRLRLLAQLCRTNAHLILYPGVTEGVAQVAVLGHGQHVLAEGVCDAECGVGVQGRAELVPPAQGR